MAGTCKRCKGQTTNTRAASPGGLCFGCEHNPCRDVMDGCQLPRRECNRRYLHGSTIVDDLSNLEIPFSIDPHDHADKCFAIQGPITLMVDYDDVDHEEVDKLAQRVVEILNDNWI